jgi:hypothetical protein
MANLVFPTASADTPALTTGWTVQAGPAGNQSMTSHAGPTALAFIAQATNSGTTQSGLNTLLTELIAAGWMASS